MFWPPPGGRRPGPPRLDHVVDVVLDGLGAHVDGVHNGAFAGRAVGLDDGAVQSQQGRAAPAVGVHAAGDGAEGVAGEQGAELAFGVFGDFTFEPGGHAFEEALQGLEDDVADKTVADHDVHAVVKEVVAFDVADEIEVDLLAEFAGFHGQLGAFVGLGAVAQNADAGRLVAENLAGVNAAHDGEFEEVAGAAFDAGAGIKENEFIFRGGNDGGDAGTVQAGQGAQSDGGGGDNPAGVAGRNQGVGLALLEEVHGAQNRAIFFAAERLRPACPPW